MQDLIKRLLAEIGEDPAREGLVNTPKRVEQALKFLTSGYQADVDTVINNALFTVDYSEMVIVKDIDFYSLCEHHLLPFFGKCHVAYIPSTKVIGLSKIPRLVDIFSRRLQVQERLTNQIADIILEKVAPKASPSSWKGRTSVHVDARRAEAELLCRDQRHARHLSGQGAHPDGIPRVDPPSQRSSLARARPLVSPAHGSCVHGLPARTLNPNREPETWRVLY